MISLKNLKFLILTSHYNFCIVHWVEIQPGFRQAVEKPTALVGNPTGEIFMRNVDLGKLNLKLS